MISRIMLSLRKAAEQQQGGWSLTEPSVNHVNLRSLKFFRPQKVITQGSDNTPLGTCIEDVESVEIYG